MKSLPHIKAPFQFKSNKTEALPPLKAKKKHVKNSARLRAPRTTCNCMTFYCPRDSSHKALIDFPGFNLKGDYMTFSQILSGSTEAEAYPRSQIILTR